MRWLGIVKFLILSVQIFLKENVFYFITRLKYILFLCVVFFPKMFRKTLKQKVNPDKVITKTIITLNINKYQYRTGLRAETALKSMLVQRFKNSDRMNF